MTVICTNHRDEIEGAIGYHDGELSIVFNFDPRDSDQGPFQIWHPDWVDDVDEETFARKDALEMGLDGCHFVGDENEVRVWIANFTSKRTIRGHVRGWVDQRELEQALTDLTWLVLREGYVKFPDFAICLLGRCRSAVPLKSEEIQKACATFSIARKMVRKCYLLAALNDDLDGRIVCLMDPPIVVRETTIPTLEEVIEGLPFPPPIFLKFD